MKHLLNNFFLFLLIGIAFGCSKDSDSPSENPTVVISNLDFTITTNEENPLQVAVTPQATNATSYKIYFDSEGSDEFQTTTGSLVTHTYPELSATYKIKAEASAPNAQDIELVKNHVVTVVEATNIADFETQSPPYIIDGDADGKIEASIVSSPDSNNTTSVLKITNVGELYEAVTIVNTQHIKITSKKVISLDFYQEVAAAPILLLKLEGNATEGGFDVEVSKTAAATSGWQTIEFDFNDAVNSYPNNEDPTVTLSEYQKVIIFIGFGQEEYAGDYYIDNVKGAEFGENQSDSDGDSVIDAIDKCPNTAGSTDNKGCPAGQSISLKVSVSVPEGTTSVRLTGPWWGWDPAGGPVAVDNEDGTWTVTFDTAPTENMEYLWVVEGTQENLIDNAAGAECTSKVDAGTLITDYANYANRVWILGSGDVSNVYDSCE
jgi:hypothetical protein